MRAGGLSYSSLSSHIRLGNSIDQTASGRWVEEEKSLCSICQTLRVEHKAGTMTRAREVVEGNLAHIIKGVCFESS